jgi:hypothetical protein
MDKQVVALVAKNGGKVPLICDVRFFLYPYESRRPVLACAEGVDEEPDIDVVFEVASPIIGDINENAMREWFLSVPSGARH